MAQSLVVRQEQLTSCATGGAAANAANDLTPPYLPLLLRQQLLFGETELSKTE